MRKSLLGLVFGCALLAGCAGAATPIYGWYADVEWSTELPNGPAGSKTGEAKATSILGIVAQGDCSISAAAKAGGITKVMTVEHHTKNILGLFAEFSTKVTGE
jgi:hypothetical protein